MPKCQYLWHLTTTYDLVSHGDGVGEECYGTYVSTTRIGYGPGYEYACMHSGVIKTSGDLSTIWYNYVLATAGTIVDENTSSASPATNTTKATESICPKGWTLPAKTQIDNQKNVASFSPVVGGVYVNGLMYDETTHGRWWGSEESASIGPASRGLLRYDGTLSTATYRRFSGNYIRCVQKST